MLAKIKLLCSKIFFPFFLFFLLLNPQWSLALGKFEAGSITLNDTTASPSFNSVTFQQTYDVTPVVVVLPSDEGSQPRSIRIKNVSTTGFDLVAPEPTGADGTDVAMTVHYMAMEPGTLTLPDGNEIEADFVDTAKYQTGFGLSGSSWESVNFDADFSSTPAVITQIQTMNNETANVPVEPSVPWLTVAQRSVTANGISIALERAEVNDGSINQSESIGYIAMAGGLQSSFTDVLGNTIEYESIYSSDSIRGWGSCYTVNYINTYTSPLVIASQITRDGSNGGWVRRCIVGTSSVTLTIDEDQDRDSERAHTTERVGAFVFSDSFYASIAVDDSSKSSGGKFEAASFNFSAGVTSWASVSFQQTYSSVPLVFVLATNDGSDPAAIRIKEVTTSGFKAGVFEHNGSDGITNAMTVDYVAIEEGEHTLNDGASLEAGTIQTNAVQHGSGVSGSESYTTINLQSSFGSPPAVIAQIQTIENESALIPGTISSPWLTTAVTSVTNSSVRLALERSESSAGSVTLPEIIAYFAVEEEDGIFTDNSNTDITYDFNVSADNLKGSSDGCYTTNFSASFLSSPLVVATKNRHDGGDGGWLRRCSLSSASVGLTVEEDNGRDNERSHTTESAGILAFSSAFSVDLDTVDLTGCAASFPDGLSSHSASGNIDFGKDALLSNSPDNILDVGSITKSNASTALTCTSVDCVSANASVAVINPGVFQITNSAVTYNTGAGPADLGANGITEYTSVVVGQNETLNFSNTQTEFRITSLSIAKDAVVNLVPGDYWIDTLILDKDVVINVSGSGTARLLINNSISLGQSLQANSPVAGGNASQLVIYGYDDISFGNNSAVTGFIYASDDLSTGQTTGIVGGLTAATISLGKDTVVVYGTDSGDLAKEVDFGEMCNVETDAAYFKLTHDGFGINCANETLVVEARATDDSVVAQYNKQVTLDTGQGKGVWYVQGNSTPLNPDNGIATYNFTGVESGSVTFELFYDQVGLVNPIVSETLDSNIHDDDTEGNINFAPNGFLITSNHYSDGAAIKFDNQTAGVQSNVYLTAYGDTGVGGCGVIETYTGTKNLKFWFDYDNPDTGSREPLVDGNSIAASLATTTNRSYAFNAGEAGPLTFKYKDVGRIKLNARDETGLPDIDITGSSPLFVVKPATFVISNTKTISGADNLAASNDSGPVFAQAGEEFTLTVNVVDAEGDSTPNYGKETPAENVSLVSSLIAPVGGVDPGLSGGIDLIATSTAAQFKVDSTNPLVWDEVGILGIQAHVTSGSYLGTDNVVGSSVNVGRFIPAYLDVNINSPELINNTNTASCGFSYQGSEITFDTNPQLTVTARTATGAVADNYFDAGAGNDFWKLGSSLSRSYADVNGNGSTVGMNTGTVNLTNFNSLGGEGLYSVQNESLVYARQNPPGATDVGFDAIVEFNVSSASITDTDGVCYDSDADSVCDDYTSPDIQGAIDAIQMRYGRAILNNAVGSELLPLQVTAEVEHWVGTGFVNNTLDDCTNPNITDVLLTIPVDSTLSTGDTSVDSWTPFNNAIGIITLSAPGEGKTGHAGLKLDLSTDFPWLRYDYGSGSLSDNPTARASFGLYQGEDPVIYRREITR